MFALILGAVVAAASPAPSSSPNVSISANIDGYSVASASGPPHADLGDALFTISRNSGVFRYEAVAGAYALPVVGLAPVPTFSSSGGVREFGYLPIAYAQWAPSARFSLTAGLLPSLLGQENPFIFQNATIERGLAWNLEPTISRGVRAGTALGKFTADLEYDDGYYSGTHRALEGLVGWIFSADDGAQFAWILPQAKTPPTQSASVANKSEYDLMVEKRVGRLQLQPYWLWVDSPADPGLGYTRNETAFAQALLAEYVFGATWSLAGRYEVLHGSSSASDESANADLVGFGPGRSVYTLTLTPTFQAANYTVRIEYAFAGAADISQVRYGLGLGVRL